MLLAVLLAAHGTASGVQGFARPSMTCKGVGVFGGQVCPALRSHRRAVVMVADQGNTVVGFERPAGGVDMQAKDAGSGCGRRAALQLVGYTIALAGTAGTHKKSTPHTNNYAHPFQDVFGGGGSLYRI